MKKIFILIFVLISIVFYGCSINDLQDTPNETIPETVIVTETVIEYVEVENTDKIEELELQLADRNKELQQYNNLINNLNELLSNVYYVYGEGGGTFVAGTGFSLKYNDKFYLITAGHVVDGEWGVHKNLGFRNTNNEWIYPKLLYYENEYNHSRDYAVFYSDKINTGFTPNIELTYPAFILGHGDKLDKGGKNIIKLFEDSSNFGGESGSPVINVNGEVLGISTGMMTHIETLLLEIDNLK